MNQVVVSLIALMLCFHPGAFGNPFAWADTVGGKGISHGNSIAVDKNNNLFVCGQMDGSFRPGNVNIKGKNNFLIKYSALGSVLWAKPLPGLICKCVSVDTYGNPCVAGYFSDTVHIGRLTLGSAGLNDFFLIKFDSLGNVLWGNSGGGNGNDYAFSVASDVAGNTNITGSFEDYINFGPYISLLSLGHGDMFVVQYDSAGNFVWAANGGGNGPDAGTAIAVDLYGNVFVTGYFNETATFHSNAIKSTGGNNMFIVKYSTFGEQLYVHTVTCGGTVVPNSMGLDGSGNVYLCGTFNGIAVFGNKTITSNADDGFVAAYDNSLNINWLNKMGGSGDDAAFGVVSDWQSNIFVTGVFTGSADFNGSKLVSEGSTDIFLVKYDAAGRILWNERAGGPGADSVFSVCVNPDDITSMTGIINTDADFGEFTLNANDSGSFFIAQMKSSPTGIDIPDNDAALFQIYPNPSQGIFNIKGLNDGSAFMNLTDVMGKTIVIPQPINNQVNIHNCPDGIYFLTIDTRNGIETEKLVKTGD